MLRVHVLGELSLELDGRPVDPPTSRRARSLLGQLAVEHRMHARSELAARFWPDVLDESARTSLRAALSAVRRSLGRDADRYLLADRERAGLADGELVWTDAAEFDRLVADGRAGEAVELYHGDLLAGLDDDWVLAARDEWRERIAGTLGQLAAAAEAAGDHTQAIAYARRAVALDPLAEGAQRELIRLLAASGDRVAALTAYDRYAERLRTDMRITPSPATRALADEVRSGAAGEAGPGAASAPPAAPATGTVTLLFTDLVGSTELLGELGEEEAERLRRVHFALLRDVALSHAGQEVKNLGDGLMVAFGSSLDAAACATGIQRAVESHNRREGNDRVRVRVGLNVGEPIRDEGDYFGTPVVIAKRLCDQAEGGQILASELVRALIGSRGGYRFRPLGARSLKGLAEPVPVCELEWEPAADRRIPLPAELERETGDLIGREPELRSLRAAWEDARAGRPHVVVVAGEPGIGKTRLVAELCRAAHAEGAVVLLGRSYEETLVPYQPFVEALRHYVGACPAEELRLQVGPRRGALAKLVPELAGADDTEARRGDDPEAERYLLFDAVASLLREASRARPAILVLDDLHWADPPSLLMLRHLMKAAQEVQLLVVATYRETEIDPAGSLTAALAELRRSRSLETIRLAGLTSGHVAELIRAHTGTDAAGELVRLVAERTEGNPFFVEEIVRHLGDGGELTLPESVKDLLLRRLRRLGEAARTALATAAVIGREFDVELLARAVGSTAEDLLEPLEEALSERVIVEAGDTVGRCAFAHALISETIYEQLSGARRALLHRRVAEALEALQPAGAGEQAAALAHHFARAGDRGRSLEYAVQAAAAAAAVYAAEAAVEHYTAALETAAALGRTPSGDAEIRRLLLDRGWIRHMTADTEAALADYGRALDAARAAGDRRLEMDALDLSAFLHKQSDVESSIKRHSEALRIAEELGDARARIGILNRLCLERTNQLDLTGALAEGERALALADETADDQDRARAIDGLKLVALQLGDLDRLAELTEELAGIERGRGELWYLQWTLLESAFAPIGRAQWDEAAARLEEALAVNRRIGDALAPALIHDAVGWLARSRGDYAEALAAGRRAIEHPGSAGWSAWTRSTLGWTLLDACATEDALEVLEPGFASGGPRADTFRLAGHLAWARFLAGDAAGADEAAERAHAVLGRMSAPLGGTFLFGFGAAVSLGRVHVAAGRVDRAEEVLVPVLDAATRAGWHEAVASAALVLASCRAGTESERLLRQSVEVASRHGLPGVEWQARSALAPLTSGDEAARLRRESRDIAERLAAGLTDERLAGRLLGAVA